MRYLIKLIFSLPKKYILICILVIVLAIILSFSEILILSSIKNFIGSLAIFNNESIDLLDEKYFYEMKNAGYRLLTTVVICGILRVSLIFYQFRTSATLNAKVSSKAFQKIINQDYVNLKSSNQSKYLSILTQDIPRVTEAIDNFITLISNSIIFTLISFSLILIETKLFLLSILVLSSVYAVIIKIFAKNLRQIGENITALNHIEASLSRSTFGSIVNIIVGNSINKQINIYKKNENKLRINQANSKIYSQIPRYIVETVGLILFTLFILFSVGNKLSFNILAQLGTLIFAFNRILPALQIVYASYANIKATAASTKNVLDTFNLKSKIKHRIIQSENYKLNIFNSAHLNNIKIDNLSFRYFDKVIKYQNFVFEQGNPTAITGRSGSGKTTLIEILLRLIQPFTGNIKLNNIDLSKIDLNYYYKNISYISQSPFLFSGTLMENISFGSQSALKKNELYENGIRLGLKDEFGEDFLNFKISDYGRNISGGQAQRCMLLKTISNIKPLMILDEPTSALDKTTAKNFNQLLFSKTKNSILIVITHSQTEKTLFPSQFNL